MTLTPPAPTLGAPPIAPAPSYDLRPLVDLTSGEQLGAWVADDRVEIDDLAAWVSAWPTIRWVGLRFDAVDPMTSPRHPGRPIVFGLDRDAGNDTARSVRRLGPWANIAVTGLGVDLVADAEALDRLRPEVGVIDGTLFGHLSVRTSAAALRGVASLLDSFDVLPVLDTSHAPHLHVDAAVSAGVRAAW